MCRTVSLRGIGKASLHVSAITLLLLLAAGCVSAQTNIGGPLTIDNSNKATYQNQDIVVTGGVVTIAVPITFNSLTVNNGATITHPAGPTNALNLTITTNATILFGGAISADGQGYPARQGPGAGYVGFGGGGSYGGEGNGPGGPTYGSVQMPTDPGSGGDSGSGGGVILLTVNGTLNVTGSITSHGSGRGSGGSILLTVGTLTGPSAGVIAANGVRAALGGGGRIAIYYKTNSYTGSILAIGDTYYGSGAGTVFMLQTTTQTYGDLIVDNGGIQGFFTPLIGPYTFDNIRVRGYGILGPPVRGTLDSTQYGMLNVTVQHDVMIEATGVISADGRGYPVESGPGKGGDDLGAPGGGGYGGEALQPAGSGGGATYGSVKTPMDLGSPGGSLPTLAGGLGGGCIRLTVNGKLTVDGRLTSNGLRTNASGGSGGSIYLTAGTLDGGPLAGGAGIISCSGGGSYYGAEGGGGRIAVYYTANTFAGSMRATCGGTGGAGTVFLQSSTQTQGDLIVDNNGTLSAGTPLIGPYTFDSVHVRGNGILSPPINGPIDPALYGRLNIMTLGDFVIEPTGYVSAKGRGFAPSNGPGAGSSAGKDYGGSGGGYGGAGGVGTGGWPAGQPYGSDSAPTDLGSGGGASGIYAGGSGGGAVLLTINGTFRVDGQFDVNGGDGQYNYYSNGTGGGAAGSLLVTANSFTGLGTIKAIGGTPGNGYGGGGGGGRIAFYTATNSFPSGSVSAAGYPSAHPGSAGTIRYYSYAGVALKSISLSPTSLAGGMTSTGTVTISAAAPTGGVTINLTNSNPLIASVPATVTVLQGQTTGTFTVTANSVTTVGTATIGGFMGGQSASANLTVKPWLSSLKLTPGSILGGASATGTVTLMIAAPAGGLIVNLASSDTSVATVPANVTVATGASSATFPVTAALVTSVKSAVITANYGPNSKTATINVNPSSVDIKTLTVSPTSVIGGYGIAYGVITLTSKAPPGGANVSLQSNNAAAAVPDSILIPEGKTNGKFQIATSAVTTSALATIEADLGASSKTAKLTVATVTVSSLTLIPNSIAVGDNAVGILILTAPVPFDVTATISSDNLTVAAPESTFVTIPAGTSSYAFYVNGTATGAANIKVTLVTLNNAASKLTKLTVTP